MSNFKYLTFNDVTRFLDARAPIRQCPSCGSQDWTLQYGRLSADSDLIFSTNLLGLGVPMELSKGDSVQALPLGRPILPLICNVCGFMKIHDYAVMKKWVDANPAPSKEERAEGQNGNNEA